MKKYNIITSVLLVCIGIYVIFYSKKFDKIVNGTPGPGFWPGILGGLLIIFSSLLAVTTVFSRKEFVAHLIDCRSRGFQQVFLMFFSMILFGIGLGELGFLPASLIFVVLIMRIMGVKSIRKLCVTSVSVTLSIYVVFVVFLGLVLPRGKLF